MILFYNSDLVYSSCVKRLFKQNKLKLISDFVSQKYIGRLLSIIGAIDRRGVYDFLEHTPFPTETQTIKSFSDVALSSAESIWKNAGDKKVSLFWSGGIDSTVALVSLIQTNPDWFNNLIIYTSKYAIEKEYPLFYQKYLNKNPNVLLLKDLEFFNPELYNSNRYVVDGSCGDQLWGCNILRLMIDDIKKPYKVFFKTPIFQNYCTTNASLVEEYIVEVVEKFPVKIDTIAQLFWMLTFTYKWDHVRWRHMSCVRDTTVHNNMHSFFNTLDFQRWAMTNLDAKVQSNWNTYKQPAKDFIFQFTGDNDYRINKLQHESLGNSISTECKGNNLYYYKLITNSVAVSDLSSYDNFI